MFLLLSFIVFATATATAASSTSSIREKYLDEIYKQQYRYTLQEIQHDREICPEFHNSAMYFAITGQRQLNRVTQSCRHNILHTTVTPAAVRPLPLNPYDRNILSNITLTDLVIFFKEFVCYTFEYVMLLISVILASCSTLFMIILLLCQ